MKLEHAQIIVRRLGYVLPAFVVPAVEDVASLGWHLIRPTAMSGPWEVVEPDTIERRIERNLIGMTFFYKTVWAVTTLYFLAARVETLVISAAAVILLREAKLAEEFRRQHYLVRVFWLLAALGIAPQLRWALFWSLCATLVFTTLHAAW